jgi:D-amino-acid dehydrogenase
MRRSEIVETHARMNERKTEVLVLGGGVIGLQCAVRLRAEGRAVTVLEAGSIGCGSSHGNCGTLTPSHSAPLEMPGMTAEALASLFRRGAPLRVSPRIDWSLWRWLLAARRNCNRTQFRHALRARAALLVHSRSLIEEQIREAGLDCQFVASGALAVFRDPKAFEKSRWQPEALAEVGIPIEILDGAATEAREPALRDGVAGGYFHPLDAQLRPDRYAAELARMARERGVAIEEHCAVNGIRREGGKVTQVDTARGPWHPREVVLALGAWTPDFARQLGLRIPIQPGKGYSITYVRPVLCPRQPLTLKEAGVCVTTWADGYRLGSTMEFGGYDTRLNRRRLDAIRAAARRYLRDPEGPGVVEEWYGWRPMTPDDLPLIGRAPGIANLVIASGHGMLGVSMSATTGMLVAEILDGRSPSVDPAPFDPARF